MAEKNITPRPHRPAFVSLPATARCDSVGEDLPLSEFAGCFTVWEVCMRLESRLLRKMGGAYFCALILMHEFQ